jgi:hypothetical protein
MPFLTEDKIRALTNHQSFERGVDYYRGGAVFDTRRVGDELRGQCRASCLDWLAQRAEEQQDLETDLEWRLRLFFERAGL